MAGYIDTAVQVNITATSATVSLPGTSIPAIFAYHTHNTDLVRTYTDLAGMVTDGFATTDPAYLMAQSIVSQNPRPEKFKVIRGTQSVQQTMTFKVTDTNAGDSVGFTLMDAAGATHAVYHTVAGGETAIQIATALAGIAVTGATLASGGTDTVTITITASGKVWYPSSLKGGTFTDTTVTTAPGTDLDAALLVDNTWYGISGEHLDATNITALAVWAEANKKIHFYTTADTGAKASGSGIFNTLKAAGYKRTIGLFCGCDPSTGSTTASYGGTGWMAINLVADPGSINPAYKSIAGTAVDSNLTSTDITNIQTNNGNFYINMSGANVTIDGRSAQGLYADITIGTDALAADIQSRIANRLVTSPKVPFTNKGIAALGGDVMAAILDMVADGFISNESGSEPTVSVPALSSILPADKSARILKTINFSCVAQGAINQVKVNGTVTV